MYRYNLRPRSTGRLQFNTGLPRISEETVSDGDNDNTVQSTSTADRMATSDVNEQVKKLLAKVETLENEKHSSGDSNRLTPKIELFSGTSTEDAKLWLGRFDQVATFYNWSDEKRVSAVLLYLRGPAETWAKRLDEDIRGDYQKFKDAFTTNFVHKAALFLLDTRFHERKMKKGETVEAFLLDLQELAKKLNKPDSETLSQFLRGLLPSMKSLVMTQSPETLADAAQMAMVAESVQKEAEAEENNSLQSTVTALTTGLQTLTSKIDSLQNRPTYHPYPPTMGQCPELDNRRPFSTRPTAATAASPGSQPFRPSSADRGSSYGHRASSGSNNQPPDSNMRCWDCGEMGHRQRNCQNRFYQASPQNRANPNIVCFGCNNVGHIRRNCPFQNGRPF